MEEVDPSFRRQMEGRLGTTLCGRYTLDELIGIGGMAAVYRGHHRNGNRVAVKVLHLELAAATHIKGRFLREGYVANKVDHPGSVRVLDDDTNEDGAVFLVMELLEGETLESRIGRRQGKLTADELVPILIRTLEVLDAAHQKQIVHRDIKPENVFLLRDGGVKVLDFGIARLLDGSRGMTRTGHFVGTPAYMAPEQARGEKHLVGPLSDLWSVGALAFRALSGRFVHEAPSPEMTMIRTATEPAPKLVTLAPSVTRELSDIIDRALALEPSARWPSALSMADALSRWLSRRQNFVPKLFEDPPSSTDSDYGGPRIQRISDLTEGEADSSDGYTRPQLTPPEMSVSDTPLEEVVDYTLPQLDLYASATDREKPPSSRNLPRLQLTDSQEASSELQTAYLQPVPAAFRPSDPGGDGRNEMTSPRRRAYRERPSLGRRVLVWTAVAAVAGLIMVMLSLPFFLTTYRKHDPRHVPSAVPSSVPGPDAGTDMQ